MHGFKSNPWQFQSILFGDYSKQAVLSFWQHIRAIPDWCYHAFAKTQPPEVLEKSIPVMVHADGCEIYKNDEFYIWSWSSVFSCGAVYRDPLLTKFPICIIPEREMMDPKVPSIESAVDFFLAFPNQRVWGKVFLTVLIFFYDFFRQSSFCQGSAGGEQCGHKAHRLVFQMRFLRAIPPAWIWWECFEKGTYRFKLQGNQSTVDIGNSK